METERLKCMLSICGVIAVVLVQTSSGFDNHDIGSQTGIEIGGTDPGNLSPEQDGTLNSLLEDGTNDESLDNLDQSLLNPDPTVTTEEEDGPNILVTEMAVVFPGKEPVAVRLAGVGDEDKTTVSLKEGEVFAVVLNFKVNQQTVSALRYQHVITADGFPVGEGTFTMGAFEPRNEPWSFKTPDNLAPEGGADGGALYKVVSRVFDDSNNFSEWEWEMFDTKE